MDKCMDLKKATQLRRMPDYSGPVVSSVVQATIEMRVS